MDIIKRIFQMLVPHRRLLIWGLLTLFFANLTRLIIPLFTKTLINDVIKGGQHEKLVLVVSAILALTVIRACLMYARSLLFENVSQSLVFDIRTGLYDHLQYMPFEFYDKHRVGEIMSRMTADIDGLRDMTSGGIINVVENFIFFFGSIIFTMFLSWQLSLVMLCLAPLVAVIAYQFGKRMRPAFMSIREQNAVLNTRAQENIAGMRVVKAFAREDYESSMFKRDNEQKLSYQLTATRIWSNYYPALEMLGSLGLPLMIGIGGYFVSLGSIDLGTLVAFTGYLWMITGPMRMLGNIINMLTRAITSAEKLFYYIDLGPSIHDKDDGDLKYPENFCGHVIFDNVSFAYGDNRVLRNIDLDVPPGSTCAIMGATGSGKTSVVNLISRFYDVREGRVLVDGIDVRDMPLKALRRNIAHVMQETFLFSETIANNIAFGRPEASSDLIQSAARAAQGTDFIAEMANGYETVVGERGLGLSGGQKQRVAIARALLADPVILVLDDATSAVDMETEYEIQRELEELMRGKTTFIIAHRISSVKNADQIIVLDDGRIAERGNHESLLEAKGLYYNMYMDQYRDFQQLENMA